MVALKKVQGRFMSVMQGLEHFHYEEKSTRLQLYPLELQRLTGNVIELYSI